jgi:DNA invertase Pin-like site-specific DNA recombinase
VADLHQPLRCAIYTRKSTEEGLGQAFNSLDAQREAGEAFIVSQQARGWTAVAERYDDGGFSGAHIERPALQRLLEAVDAGGINCVLVYKVDRLSRSLLDFARLMERFERRGISFVSVTQEFNTTTSMGRLTLNILLSFAQFEREIIGERTRDKLSAARRKGKWIGGWPVLGYDVKDGRLAVNLQEAEQVREIYRIAAEAPSLETVVQICAARVYQTKCWTSQGGATHPARPFHRMTLRLLLPNVLYTGAVSHKGTVYPGEHDRIVDQQLWEQVNRQLQLRSTAQRGKPHRAESAPLSGLTFCIECGSAMRLTHTMQHGRRYQYYSCQTGRRGTEGCSQGPIRAGDLEASLLRALEPSLGAPLDWNTIRSSVERIDCQTTARRVSIQFRDGTRTEYEVPKQTRPGIKVEVKSESGGRIPRVSRLMALAIKLDRTVREGRVRSYRSLAEAGHISRARLSQIMHLMDLSPDIQEQLLFLPKTIAGPDPITEKALRQIARSVDWDWQRKQFRTLLMSSLQQRNTI